ncbi:MAG: hypothetical protein JSW71_21585 [Gemmatimonadota bacterium]|nr:MAG: hypothetical protein JSW71_21585 [Gemmatimonadota bacterium]
MIFELIDEKHERIRYAPRAGRISYSSVPVPEGNARDPLIEVQHVQQFLDLSCFAERWWQERTDSEPDAALDASAVPWRPIWAARNLEFDTALLNPEWHYAGANQVCLVCDVTIEEPNTLCNTCGEALTRLYLQRYGIDLH